MPVLLGFECAETSVLITVFLRFLAALLTLLLEVVARRGFSGLCFWTAREPRGCCASRSEGHLVEGHACHRYYFDLASQTPSAASSANITMARPHLRWLSDEAVVVSYTPINSNNPQRRTHHIPLLRDKDMATKRRNLDTSARSPLLKPGKRKKAPPWSDTLPVGRPS